MVSRWSVNNALTIEERIKLKEGLDLGMCYREIGKYVGRHKSTMVKEAKRLGTPENYDPIKAQEDFERKQKEKGVAISNTLRRQRA